MKVMGESKHIQMKGGASLVRYKPLFSPDSKFLFVCCGTTIKVLSTSTGECIHNLAHSGCLVISLQLNPKNHLQLLSCDADGTVIKWDYVDGVILKRYKISSKLNGFFAPFPCDNWFVIDQQGPKCFSLKSIPAEERKVSLNKSKTLLKKITNQREKISFGANNELVAAVNDDKVFVHWFKFDKFFKWSNGLRQLTCCTVHPHDYCIATGDNTGRILLWYNFLNGAKPTFQIYHWHTLSVADIAFSAEGSHFFSGGGECVLVKWGLGSRNWKAEKSFLPRMGMPLCYVTSSSDNLFVATSHVDNAIHLINSNNEIVHVYQGLTQGHQWSKKIQSVGINNPIPTGMIFDPRSKSLVLNGKPGHLQFYNFECDDQLFNLDVVGQNYISQERHNKVINTDIIKAAFDSDGDWLATVQYRDDGILSYEMQMKFWKFDFQTQRYTLVTTIEQPHEEIITEIKFRPKHQQNEPLLVTLSNDTKFKIWTVDYSPRSVTGEECWRTKYISFFRSMVPTSSSFCEDGSVLAVAFDSVLTLWFPDSNIMKSSLIHPTVDDPIKNVEFGQKDCSHLIAVATNNNLTIWNAISLSVSWQVVMNISFLKADPFSNLMSIFTSNKKVFVFKPSCSSPVYSSHLNKSDVLHAAFIPCQTTHQKNSGSLPWEKNSILVFMNSSQHIYKISDFSSGNSRNRAYEIKSKIPKTPFGKLIAEKNKSYVEKPDSNFHLSSGLPGSKEVNELIMASAHVLPSATSLCSDFINLLLISKENENEQNDIDDEQEESLMSDSSSEMNEDDDEAR